LHLRKDVWRKPFDSIKSVAQTHESSLGSFFVSWLYGPTILSLARPERIAGSAYCKWSVMVESIYLVILWGSVFFFLRVLPVESNRPNARVLAPLQLFLLVIGVLATYILLSRYSWYPID
jgi:hypothetical protein